MGELSRNLALAGAALLLALVAAELVLRVAVGRPERAVLTPVPRAIRQSSPDPALPYVLRPGARVVHRYPSDPRGSFEAGATRTYNVNGQGFRGPEVPEPKPPGAFRIIGLGDSFTFGTGVRGRDTFLAVLERELRREHTARRIRVLNFGVMGYDTVHEVALLRRRAPRFEPDLALFVFFLNDVQVGATHTLFNVSEPRHQLAARASRSFLVDRVLWWWTRRSQVADLVASYQRSFEEAAPGWTLARLALDDAAAFAAGEDFELALVIFPVLWQLSGDYPFAEIHEKVRAFAESRGIPVLDLLPEFEGYEGPELWVHPTDQHPNEVAHAAAGRALARFLAESGLVPQASDAPAR